MHGRAEHPCGMRELFIKMLARLSRGIKRRAAYRLRRSEHLCIAERARLYQKSSREAAPSSARYRRPV